MPSLPSLRVLACAVLTLVVVAGGACSSDSDSGSPTTTPSTTTTSTTATSTTATSTTTAGSASITLAEWQAQTTAVCLEFEPQQEAVAAEHPDSSTFADVVELIDALRPVVDRYVAKNAWKTYRLLIPTGRVMNELDRRRLGKMQQRGHQLHMLLPVNEVRRYLKLVEIVHNCDLRSL